MRRAGFVIFAQVLAVAPAVAACAVAVGAASDLVARAAELDDAAHQRDVFVRRAFAQPFLELVLIVVVE